MDRNYYLAIDLGAESGRAVIGSIDEGKLMVEEIHRFPNAPVTICGTLYWDILNIYANIIESLNRYQQRFGDSVNGIGIDSWAVDFGLIDRYGNLLQNPVCYRDSRTEGMFERVEKSLSKREVFDITGIGLIPIYTLCQLKSLRIHQPELLKSAEKLLLIPDLLNYFLCGSVGCEQTNAITTQLYDPRQGTWSHKIFDLMDFPYSIMADINAPGTYLGELRDSIKVQTGLRNAPVVSVCSHDTGSAVAAVPAAVENYGFISSGTWSVVGMMTGELITTDEAFSANVCNELTAEGLFLCRNIMGLWLLQQARAAWRRKGISYSYDDLVHLAGEAPRSGPLVMVDDPTFLHPTDMVEAIRVFCQKTGQKSISSDAGFVCCILESLALAYRQALNQIHRITGRRSEILHIVGGGALNSVLCQYTANATGITVLAGPQDATATGNILVQALSRGDLKSIKEIHEVVRSSSRLVQYEPCDNKYWEDRIAYYNKIIKTPED